MDDNQLLEVLKYNQGFSEPEIWLEYARKHNFEKVKARTRTKCPDCSNSNFSFIGQYVYYSQLIRIQKCRKCNLWFSDVVIEKKKLIEHFEGAYKDDEYFKFGRDPIFRHIANLVKRRISNRQLVVDVGGATGHMAKNLLEISRNYEIIVNDLSRSACRKAEEKYSVKSICCSLEELHRFVNNVDAILLIDVLYYVEDINQAWFSISKCLKKGGIIIVRLPNKLWWIEIYQKIRNIIVNSKLDTKVYKINPEHVYFFSHSYLNKKFMEFGFRDIEYSPSPLTRSNKGGRNIVLKLIYIFSKLIYHFSFKKICLTPAQIIIARKT